MPSYWPSFYFSSYPYCNFRHYPYCYSGHSYFRNGYPGTIMVIPQVRQSGSAITCRGRFNNVWTNNVWSSHNGGSWGGHSALIRKSWRRFLGWAFGFLCKSWRRFHAGGSAGGHSMHRGVGKLETNARQIGLVSLSLNYAPLAQQGFHRFIHQYLRQRFVTSSRALQAA